MAIEKSFVYRGLLDAILESPEDDFPRLILADWLQDNGDEERAEFIRLGIQLATLDKASAEAVLLKELLDTLARPIWLLETAAAIDISTEPSRPIGDRSSFMDFGTQTGHWKYPWRYIWWTWERGFVGAVKLELEDWLKYGLALIGCQPLTRVCLTGKAPFRAPFLDQRYWWHSLSSLAASQIGELWEWLPETRDGLNDGYKTEEAALRALSEGCLRWARSEQ